MSKAPETWRPLLDGDLAARAREAVDQIAQALGQSRQAGLEPSLSWGAAGLSLLFGYLATDAATASDRHADLAELYLDAAVRGLASVPMSTGLYSGFTGVAWTSEHLSRLLGLEPADPADPNAGIDQALLETLADPWKGHFDLGTGLAGLGVYALERLPRATAVRCLAVVVDNLAASATRDDRGTTWHTPPERLPAGRREEEPRGIHDLGVPHGVPGVISLLASASQVEACAEPARPLLDGAVRWLLSLPRADRAGFRVGKWLSLRTNKVMPARRLAWCYGDPGVAATLLYAARTLGEIHWEREAVALATTAAQAPIDGSGVVDGCLCHGAVGLAHLFNRIYQATAQELFADAARRWYRRGLDMLDEGTATDTVDDTGLFTGTAGIGLGLLAAVSDREPEWDRLFGVAIPPSASQKRGQRG